jgi:hypothetical protein
MRNRKRVFEDKLTSLTLSELGFKGRLLVGSSYIIELSIFKKNGG